MEKILKIKGMHCKSCERVIAGAVNEIEGVNAVYVSQERGEMKVGIAKDEDVEKISKAIAKGGYEIIREGKKEEEGKQAGESTRSRARDFLLGLFSGREGFEIENRLFAYAAFSIVSLLIALVFFYFTAFNRIPRFLEIYAPLLVLAAAGIPTILFAFFHAQAFRRRASCMGGMMVGMTIGMMAGFLLGALAGATNGMFVGSLVGMGVGMLVGFEAGRCCGVMGAMEGLMGGLMAGTMGAMLSVMMVTDNLILFLYILFACCLAILAGMSYMIRKEHGKMMHEHLQISLGGFFLICLGALLFLCAIMIFGPKAGIVIGG
ncbi:hypothetical protein AUJ17_05325 [Candidatus Micrarchaeota archaeon CG1_02_47_40]|nr:MAG: hypothetical protein AUJ17_05325 [Candidatus Micrarchaeota archaeon CG1_02_47_40]